MKRLLVVLSVLLAPSLLKAQQTPEWYRVYTFEDSVIEMNTIQVRFSGKSRGLARFRWSFDKAEALSGEPQTKYKSRVEVIEFDCSNGRFRPREVTFFDTVGKVVRFEERDAFSPWSHVASGSMTEKLYAPACKLIELRRYIPPPPSSEEIEIENVKKIALAFAERLEKTKDFAPLVKEFFAKDYLDAYLRDKDTNRFLILNRDVAAQVSRAELQRYHIALLNVGYLGSSYFISQASALKSDYSAADDKVIDPGLVNLIQNHPYTAAYKDVKSSYDYLAENIDDPERLRRYTDLLESVAALFRRNIVKASAEKSTDYYGTLDNLTNGLYRPQTWVCSRECWGLPKGTKIFQVNVLVFKLQLARIDGELKIISAMPHFQ